MPTAPQGHSSINLILAEPRAEAGSFSPSIAARRDPATPENTFLRERAEADAAGRRRDIAIRRGRRPLPSHDLKGVNFRRHAVAVANAELNHAHDDWARLVAANGGSAAPNPSWGIPESNQYRLPHERAAAIIANMHGHLIGGRSDWDAAKIEQRGAEHLRVLLWVRRRNWADFLAAVAKYRALRAAIDLPLAIAAE